MLVYVRRLSMFSSDCDSYDTKERLKFIKILVNEYKVQIQEVIF